MDDRGRHIPVKLIASFDVSAYAHKCIIMSVCMRARCTRKFLIK